MKERQNAIPCGIPSIPSGESTVDPVVVSPEMLSKRESMKESKVPPKEKGSAAATPPTSHESPTTAMPSRRK